jgi:hypothetical protein
MDAFTPVDVTPSYTAGVLQGGNSLPIGFMRVGSFTEDNYLNTCADEWKNFGRKSWDHMMLNVNGAFATTSSSRHTLCLKANIFGDLDRQMKFKSSVN